MHVLHEPITAQRGKTRWNYGGRGTSAQSILREHMRIDKNTSRLSKNQIKFTKHALQTQTGSGVTFGKNSGIILNVFDINLGCLDDLA